MKRNNYMQKLFKNAQLVDIENDDIKDVDILIEDGKIVSFEKRNDFFGETIDLEDNFVLPCFVNSFCDSVSAFEKNFSDGVPDDLRGLCGQYLLQQNVFAGAVTVNDISVQKLGSLLLENVQDLEETQLSSICDDCAKRNLKLFMKVGLNLDELGTVDKKFGKMEMEVLEDFGLLDRKAVVVGGNCFEKDEWQILKNYEVPVVLTPIEDGLCGRRLTNLVTLKNMGFEIGVGSGNLTHIDFFEHARHLLMCQRSSYEDKDILSEADVLKIVMQGNVLGVKNAVEIGAKANFIVVNDKSNTFDSVVEDIVWTKSTKDVLMTVFNGVILQKNGKILMQNLTECDKIIDVIQQRRRNLR